jgi:hypothetical protein
MSESWIAVISIAVGIGALIGAIAGVVFYARTAPGPDTAQRDPYDLAESVNVVSDLDGSHENLDDVDQFRWAEEVLWLTEMYEADEVPIIPGRDRGEGR